MEITPGQLKCPVMKFSTPMTKPSTAAQAEGFWKYTISGLVPPGHEVAGIRGKLGNVTMAVKSAGWSGGRHG
jgi:hypothetical protein